MRWSTVGLGPALLRPTKVEPDPHSVAPQPFTGAPSPRLLEDAVVYSAEHPVDLSRIALIQRLLRGSAVEGAIGP